MKPLQESPTVGSATMETCVCLFDVDIRCTIDVVFSAIDRDDVIYSSRKLTTLLYVPEGHT